ncbi:MAG: hypothetical protein JWP25_8944 [Bradyrhizobium sp.]|nr:hypothetical protein [Bradyrhizobium sp.]
MSNYYPAPQPPADPSAANVGTGGSAGTPLHRKDAARGLKPTMGTGGTAGIDPTSMDAIKHGDCGPASYSGN